jgi:hypothetical protein
MIKPQKVSLLPSRLKTQSGRFVVNNIDKPYVDDPEKLVQQTTDAKLADALRQHRA